MSRKYLIIALIFSIFLAFPAKALADIGVFLGPGGTINPGKDLSPVIMKSERVVFEIRPDRGEVFPVNEENDWGVGGYSARVEAEFAMYNPSSSSVFESVYFPFHDVRELEYFSPNSEANQAKNVVVTVNGQKIDITYNYLEVEDPEERVIAGVFKAEFPSLRETIITVSYDAWAVPAPHSDSHVFKYLLETGASWAGSIGEGEIIFDFWMPLGGVEKYLHVVNGDFRVDDQRLVWRFKNLEPNANNNISLSFDGVSLGIFEKNQSYLKGLLASDDLYSCYPFYLLRDPSLKPDGELRGWEYEDCSVINVLRGDDEKNPKGFNAIREYGWVAKLEEGGSRPWLHYFFNGTYQVKELAITPGIGRSIWDKVASKEVVVYDIVRRPRSIKIVYSDGSETSTVLSDSLGKPQNIALASKETSSLRIIFEDFYSGVSDGNNYFGVGRLAFKLGDKTSDVSESVSFPQIKVYKTDYSLTGATQNGGKESTASQLTEKPAEAQKYVKGGVAGIVSQLKAVGKPSMTLLMFVLVLFISLLFIKKRRM